jgi:hypothetical protein
MGEAKRKRGDQAEVVVMIHGRAEERLLLPDHAMTAQEAAAMFEARGLTSTDKHDLSIAVLGNRVRIAEVGVDEETGRVKVVAGETDIQTAKAMLSTLPVNHNLGIVDVVLGQGYDCDEFLAFIRQQASVKNFSFTTMHGPRSAQQAFDHFYEALGDTEPQGTC